VPSANSPNVSEASGVLTWASNWLGANRTRVAQCSVPVATWPVMWQPYEVRPELSESLTTAARYSYEHHKLIILGEGRFQCEGAHPCASGLGRSIRF
jgi:hypothetical protein